MLMARIASRLNCLVMQSRRAASRDRIVACLRAISSGGAAAVLVIVGSAA
jgi:hypothetical protein